MSVTERPSALLISLAAVWLASCASTDPVTPTAAVESPASSEELAGAPPPASTTASAESSTYQQSELVTAISDHLGVTSESAASAIERLFRDRGRPVGYITGEEGGGALTIGARYGQGTLWLKDGRQERVYWQGPSIGFDVGAEASKVFTLVYGLDEPDDLYRRYPGVDGSAFLVAGMAVNVQRANGITLAPVRSGVGLRLGANIGYTSFTRKRSLIPL